MRPPYRGDVDGLRAVAVLLVVAFHAFPRKLPGGFTGVDIFFVISGFLITSLILRSKENGDFSFTDFYARRIKRIFPALIAMLAACLAVGWFVMFPGEFRDLGKHAAAGAGFVANFSFLQEAGYFDITADHKPLLHLWSLGIEEQFYIVWPALIVLVWRWKNGPLLMAALLCLGSLVWNVALTNTNQSQAFYLPFTRFWELMVGCIVAFATTQRTDATIVKVHRHGQEGDPEPGDRPFQGRHDNLNPGADRRTRQSRPLCSPARPALRYGWRRSAHRRSRLRRIDRRQGLRQQSYHCRVERARRQNRHLTASAARCASSARCRTLQVATPDRELLLLAQGIQTLAMRADKTDQSFAANIYLAAAMINSR